MSGRELHSFYASFECAVWSFIRSSYKILLVTLEGKQRRALLNIIGVSWYSGRRRNHWFWNQWFSGRWIWGWHHWGSSDIEWVYHWICGRGWHWSSGGQGWCWYLGSKWWSSWGSWYNCPGKSCLVPGSSLAILISLCWSQHKVGVYFYFLWV